MSWFKSKSNEALVQIECPYCGLTQEVAENISAVFCKECKKTIFTKKAIKKTDMPLSSTAEVKTEPVSSSFESDKIETEIVKPQVNPQTISTPIQTTTAPPSSSHRNISPVPSTPASSSMKKITCSNCHTVQDVPSIALASFCEKCGQRINLQDYKIKGHFRGELETRGEIRIATGADVQANLNVGSVVVDGKIKGEISAEYKVELNPGCLVQGTINSPVLIVRDGAGFVGKAIINPPKEADIS